MSTTKNHVAIAATEYRMRGFSVIPLRSKDKRPTLDSWDPYKTNKATWDEIDLWFRVPKNIGIVTGAVSGIFVLDIDGPEGEEALAAMTSRFGDLPTTWVSTTGKGRHFLFLHPGVEIRNKASKKLSIDFRADGGYIVAPPSIHPSGAEYKWAHADDVDIAKAPDWIIEWITADKQPSWIEEILIDLGRSKTKNEKNKETFHEKNIYLFNEKNNSCAENVLKSCAFCQHCKDNATDLSEPMWHAMVTNLAKLDGGAELVHELSAPHPSYSEKETTDKIERAKEKGEPHTCDYIQNTIGFDGCPPDGCGVKAPIVFGTSELHLANSLLGDLIGQLKLDSKPSSALIYDQKVIDALVTLERKDMAQFAVIKQELKRLCKELNLVDLLKAMKARAKVLDEQRSTTRIEEFKKQNQNLSIDVDFGFKVTIPDRWLVNTEGVHFLLGEDQIRVLPVPLYLTRRIINVDSGEEKVRLSFQRDGDWREINVTRPVAFNRSQITSLSVHSLPVTSENAKETITYLSAFEAAHMDVIPVTKSVSRMGWMGSKEFLPGAAPNVELDVDPGMVSIASGYTASGSLDEWIRCTEEARKSPLVRMLMAASFAAPMLRLVGHRVFLVHVWGPSRGGKTAALKAALSVWGDPETIMASFNSTRVGLERLAGFYCDLPLGVDERQLVGNKQDLIESLVYLIGMGKGKTRGTKGGGIQAAQSWRTIALTTGEEPLSGESSNTGIRTRVVELYGEPFTDEKVAANVHQVTKDHHGHAGTLFINSLIEQESKNSNVFKDAHKQFSDFFSLMFPRHMGATISQLAMLAVGDMWSSIKIYNKPFDQAMRDSVKLIESFATQIQTSESADESVIASQKLFSWLNQFSDNFGDKTFQRFGYRKSATWYILSHKFDEVMQDLNFNATRMLRDWAKRGWIETENSKNYIRYRVRYWDDSLKQRYECIAFVGPKEQSMEEID